MGNRIAFVAFIYIQGPDVLIYIKQHISHRDSYIDIEICINFVKNGKVY